MPAKKIVVAAAVVALPLLGGCQTAPSGSAAVRGNAAMLAQAEAGYAAAQIAAGRKALDDGQLAAAVAAFRNARQYPDQAADASNGLAVAYAQLGRGDLAERYFRQAIALAPGERRFQVNLMRFYQANPVEVAVTASPQPVLSAAPVPQLSGAVRVLPRGDMASTLTVSRPAARLVRISAGEVRLAGSEPSPVAPKAAAVAIVRQAGAGYPVRVAIAPREVFVGRAASSVPTGAPAKDYPVRVELKASR